MFPRRKNANAVAATVTQSVSVFVKNILLLIYHLFRDSTEHAMTIETKEPSSINVVAVVAVVVDTLPVRTKIKALIIIIIINHCLSYFVL
jgi:hypothetical protein